MRQYMRALFAVLALLGLSGIVIGVLIIIQGMRTPHGQPFSFENYGGPGPIIAGIVVLAVSLYLGSIWKSRP
jgi:ABC-type transport system involved in multi-copper enzyme maturation permease subunit